MRPIGPHEGCNLYAVDDGIEGGGGLRFGADGIDAAVRAATLGQFLDALVDVFGSGTLSQRMSPLPCQASAFIETERSAVIISGFVSARSYLSRRNHRSLPGIGMLQSLGVRHVR
jgi:hypothetical protein